MEDVEGNAEAEVDEPLVCEVCSTTFNDSHEIREHFSEQHQDIVRCLCSHPEIKRQVPP